MRQWRPEFGWLALASFVLLLGVWWLPGSDTLSTDSYSVTHGGKKAFFKVLRAFEAETAREQERLVNPLKSAGTLMVLGPARYPSEAEWTQLAGEVADGMTLVFATSPYGKTDVDLKPFGVKVVYSKSESKREIKSGSSLNEKAEAEDSAQESDEASKENAAEETFDDFMARLRRRGASAKTELVAEPVNWIGAGHLTIASNSAEVLLTVNDEPCVARVRYGNGAIVVCSSDEIFSNAAMLDPNRALLAYRIVERAGLQAPILFDESLNISGVPKVFGSLFAPAIRPITLQLFLILVLFGWAGSRRFGPVAPSIDKPRRSIVEHAEALGSLYYRAAAGAVVLSRWLEHLRWELRLGSKDKFRARDIEMLARWSKTPLPQLRALMKSAAQEIRSPTPSNSNIARLIQKLAEVRARIGKKE